MLLILVGFASLLAQVVLLREMGVAHHGGEIVYVLGLAVWLLAGAVGASLQRIESISVAAAATALAVTAPVGLVIARALRPLLGAVPGVDLDLPRVLLGAVLVLAPSGALAGFLFRRAAAKRLARGGSRGRIYALECLGAALGGAVASALTMVGAPALMGAAGAGLVALGATWTGGRSWRPAAVGLAVPLVVAMVLAGSLDLALTRWTHPDVVLSHETPRGRLTFDRNQDRLAVFQDDALVHASEDPGAEELVHLAATQRDTVGRVLVLGGWLENATGQLASYDPHLIVSLEPDRDLVQLAAPMLPERLDPAEVTFADPRVWLPAGDGAFDLIVSALPDPVTARANRFWTAEFVTLCATRLTTDGVLALRLRTSENLWTPRQARRVASVHRALLSAFADVQVLPGRATILLASNRPLERDPDVLAARLERAAPPTVVVSPAWLEWRWTGDRTADAAVLLAGAAVPANSDLRPVCFGDTLLWELGRWFPGLGWKDAPSPSRWLLPTMLLLAVAAAVARRNPAAPGLLVAGFAGLAAMMLTSVLLLHHQTVHGVLYRDLGLLLTLFMLGQAAGAALSACIGRQRTGRRRLPGLVVVLSIWSFLAAMGLQLGGNLVTSLVWLSGTGVITAMIFAGAACRAETDLGRLYAADLLGGCVGALLAALLLIPFSGLPVTALTVAGLAFPAALAVWPLPGRSAQGPNG